MKSKIKYIENTYNNANSLYFTCKNCGKLLALAGTKIYTDILCKCDKPEINNVIYINPKKESNESGN